MYYNVIDKPARTLVSCFEGICFERSQNILGQQAYLGIHKHGFQVVFLFLSKFAFPSCSQLLKKF